MVTLSQKVRKLIKNLCIRDMCMCWRTRVCREEDVPRDQPKGVLLISETSREP